MDWDTCAWHVCVCVCATQGKQHREDLVVARFKDCIDDFKSIMPLIEECANPALQKRHWYAIHTHA